MLILLLLGMVGCFSSKESVKTESIEVHEEEQEQKYKDKITYELVKIEDISYNNVVRLKAKVIIPNQLESDLIKVLSQIIVKEYIIENTKVNAVAIQFYERKEDIEYGSMPVAEVDWAPYGDWEKAGDFSTGNYTYHEYKLISYKDNSNSYKPTERELAIYDAYNKACESPGNPYDNEPSNYENFEEWNKKQDKIIKAWENDKAKEVGKQFGITAEEVKDIWWKVTQYKFKK